MSKDKNKEILLEKVREFEMRTGQTTDSWPIDPNNTASVLGERRRLSEPVSDKEARKEMAVRSRRGFLIGGAAALLGVFGWRGLGDDAKNKFFEKVFRFNERVGRALFDENDLAPEFPPELATERVNGMIGLDSDLDPDKWRLQVTGIENPLQYPEFSPSIVFMGGQDATGDPGVLLTLDDIKALPRIEMTTEFKCIEGWSIIVNWTGVRFSDLAARFFHGLNIGETPDLHNLPAGVTKYVSLVTPDQEYYVGWDIASILHPQTLLAYEMNGRPLTPEHGAPLRLVSTTKYGIKQLKRIGRIEFTNERPRDYWAEQDYDWYSGF